MLVEPKPIKPDYLVEVEDSLNYSSFEIYIDNLTGGWGKWRIVLDGAFDSSDLRDFAARLDRANAERS